MFSDLKRDAWRFYISAMPLTTALQKKMDVICNVCIRVEKDK